MSVAKWVSTERVSAPDEPTYTVHRIEGGSLSKEQRDALIVVESNGSFQTVLKGKLSAQTIAQAKREVFQHLEAETRNKHLAIAYAAHDLGY